MKKNVRSKRLGNNDDGSSSLYGKTHFDREEVNTIKVVTIRMVVNAIENFRLLEFANFSPTDENHDCAV